MEYKEEYEYAQAVIKIAGELVSAEVENKPHVEYKKDASWVTQIDKEVEQLIRNKLTSKYPDYGFLGEEGDEDIKDISWIVDPIDGTIAFTRQIPEFGIVIAFKKGNDVIFSVQYIPSTNKILTAYKGHGAFCNGKQLKIAAPEEGSQLLFSVKEQLFWWPEYIDYIVNLVKSHRFRTGHSTLVEGYYLAEGKVDGFIRFKQPIWDTAPECLLMEEAGAVITDEFNQPLHLEFSKTSRYNIIAVHPSLNKKLGHLLFMKHS